MMLSFSKSFGSEQSDAKTKKSNSNGRKKLSKGFSFRGVRNKNKNKSRNNNGDDDDNHSTPSGGNNNNINVITPRSNGYNSNNGSHNRNNNCNEQELTPIVNYESPHYVHVSATNDQLTETLHTSNSAGSKQQGGCDQLFELDMTAIYRHDDMSLLTDPQSLNGPSTLTQMYGGNGSVISDTASALQLEDAHVKIHSLVHNTNNLKEALKQVLTAKRLVQAELNLVKNELDAVKGDNELLRRNVAEEKAVARSMGLGDVTSLRRDKEALANEFKAMEREHQLLELQLGNLREELNTSYENVENLKLQLTQSSATSKTIQTGQTAAEKERDAALDSVKRLREELERVKTEKMTEAQTIMKLQLELSEVQSNLTMTSAELRIANNRLEDAERRRDDEVAVSESSDVWRTKVCQMKQQFETAKNELKLKLEAAHRESKELSEQVLRVEEAKADIESELKEALSESHQSEFQLEVINESKDVLVQQNNDMKNEVETLRRSNHDLKLGSNKAIAETTALETKMSRLSSENVDLKKSLADVRLEISTLHDAKSKDVELERKHEELASEHEATVAQLNAARSELSRILSKSEDEAKRITDQYEEKIKKLAFHERVHAYESKGRSSDTKYTTAQFLAQNELNQERIESLQNELAENEQIRRDMHNKIQALQGNIRVFVRVRPFLQTDEDQKSAIVVAPNGASLRIRNRNNNENQNFAFDRVFPPTACQEIVFNNVQDYIQSALDGYSVCLFSYGQTGAGKTFTMHGIGNSEMRGIIPRAIEYIYSHHGAQNGQWRLGVTASYLEIYNEELRDLLLSCDTNEPQSNGNTNMDGGKALVNQLTSLQRAVSRDSRDSNSPKAPNSPKRGDRTPIAANKSPSKTSSNRTGTRSSGIQRPSVSPTKISTPSPKRLTTSAPKTPSPHSSSIRGRLSNGSNSTTPRKRSSSKSSVRSYGTARSGGTNYTNQSVTSAHSNASNSTRGNKLHIKRNSKGKTYVEGLTKIKVDGENLTSGLDHLQKLMEEASKTRAITCTKYNALSSRSHGIFMLETSLTNDATGETINGRIHFCDLAGNEKFDHDSQDTKLMKEMQSINRSLSCLGDVFHALAKGSSHVPFRNSKLTYLLQDCLSGDGKALMIGNVCPSVDSSYESITSLRFVQRVNKIELGRATKDIRSRR